MITKMVLQNFQSHKNTTINLTEGLNSFQGASSQGKSSIIRGLRWAVFNRPSGTSFINRDAFNDKGKQVAPCSVTLYTDDGCIVERYRDANKNSYTVGNVKLKAVRTDVPEEVSKALNLDDINFQFQMDSPFMLTETAGEVARMLNRVVKLDNIDTTLKQINTYSRRLNTQKDQFKYVIDDLEKQILKNDIEDVEQSVELYEQLETVEGNLTEKQKDLKALDYQLRLIHDRIDGNTVVAREELIELGMNLYQKYEKVAYSQSSLLSVASSAKALQEKEYNLIAIDTGQIDKLLVSYNSTEESYNKLSALQDGIVNLKTESLYADIDVEFIEKLQHTYWDIVATTDDLVDLGANIESKKKAIVDRELSITNEEEGLHKLLGDKCPLCGKEI